MENTNNKTFTDPRDGNVYNTVKIDDQTWMADNLAYLPSVSPSPEGAIYSNSYTDPYYYVYSYEGTDVNEAKATDNYETYGVLYNWQAAIEACPDGWHLPSDEEQKQLEMFFGMSQSDVDLHGVSRRTNQGSKLAGNSTLWENGNLEFDNGFNSSGFTALPAGFRSNLEYFIGIGGYTTWWSSSEYDTYRVWSRELDYEYTNLIRCYYYKDSGYSVRCLKDE